MARGTSGRDRLDQPLKPGRRLRGPNVDPEAFGVATERIARYLGTGRYLVMQTVLIIVWIAVQFYPPIAFDGAQLGLLTLILSLQAAYAAPLILLAQNRQDDRDRANNLEDRQQANRNLEDTEFLARELADIRMALGEAVTRDFLRNELRDLLEEVNERTDGAPGLGGPGGGGLATGPKKKKRKRRPAAPRGAEPSEVSLSEPQRPEEDGDEEVGTEHPAHPAGSPARPEPEPAPAEAAEPGE